jgi:hypothetical protein
VSNISWSSETTPVPKEVNPSAVFERLFGSANERDAAEGRAKRLRYRKSILDLVADDARRLSRDLGKGDQRKLDEFTTSIREIEKRVERDREQQAQLKAQAKVPDVKLPEDVPDDLQEHFRLMADMLVLLEMSRTASWAASYAVSTHAEDAERLAHVAKSYCCDALSHIAGEAVQLHGGIAITWEHDAQLVFKRAHALSQLFDSPREHRRLVAL